MELSKEDIDMQFVNDTPDYAVLNSGYVKFIEHWGSDERIIESARMSTNKGFQGWGQGVCIRCKGTNEWIEEVIIWDEKPQQFKVSSNSMRLVGGKSHTEKISRICGCGNDNKQKDEKLLKYLYEHKHMTPFEMCGMTVEIKAPIFVFREWHRHRTQSYNEMSARYTQMPNDHYIPSIERILQSTQKSNNKQESGSGESWIKNENDAIAVQILLGDLQQQIYIQYEKLLEAGLSKELARINTPVSRYSKMRASANLRNWLAFLTLRMDKNAQWEIREYANCVGKIISNLFPRTWELFAK